jgi:predicted nucleic acid-binding protein
MGLAVLDASVLIAFLDATDGHHAAAQAGLDRARSKHQLVASAIAYAEVLVGAYRSGAVALEEADLFFEETVRVEPLSTAMARRAAEIRAKHKVRLVDAMILGTAAELSADQTLTADARWKKMGPRVTVIGG